MSRAPVFDWTRSLQVKTDWPFEAWRSEIQELLPFFSQSVHTRYVATVRYGLSHERPRFKSILVLCPVLPTLRLGLLVWTWLVGYLLCRLCALVMPGDFPHAGRQGGSFSSHAKGLSPHCKWGRGIRSPEYWFVAPSVSPLGHQGIPDWRCSLIWEFVRFNVVMMMDAFQGSDWKGFAVVPMD